MSDSAIWHNQRIVRQIEDGQRLNRFVRLWTVLCGIGYPAGGSDQAQVERSVSRLLSLRPDRKAQLIEKTEFLDCGPVLSPTLAQVQIFRRAAVQNVAAQMLHDQIEDWLSFPFRAGGFDGDTATGSPLCRSGKSSATPASPLPRSFRSPLALAQPLPSTASSTTLCSIPGRTRESTGSATSGSRTTPATMEPGG